MNLLFKIALGAAAAVPLAAAANYYYNQRSSSREVNYRTAPVKRDDILATISASGTIVPEEVIDVGTQVNGRIASFGKDSEGGVVDYRSKITTGLVLARIDDSLYSADLATANAQVSSARAQVTLSKANLDQNRAKLDQAERDWNRAQKLGSTKALAQADYDAARSAYEQAKAAVSVAEAQIGQAEASMQTAEAACAKAKQNYDYCTIASPVDGVIIDRRVQIGQTVVASLSAPSLFLIARDLRRAQILVQVNEADVGHVQPDQRVVFTVDAFPGDLFRGVVKRLRLNASMTQNVVTYTAEINVDNPDLKLLPYLTANVTFEVDRHDHVLTVPNAALRWSPKGADAASADPGAASAAPRPNMKEGRVWVLDGGRPRAVVVHTRLADAAKTEIDENDLPEGAEVILAERVERSEPASDPANAPSPFTPQMFRGRSGGR